MKFLKSYLTVNEEDGHITLRGYFYENGKKVSNEEWFCGYPNDTVESIKTKIKERVDMKRKLHLLADHIQQQFKDVPK